MMKPEKRESPVVSDILPLERDRTPDTGKLLES
jgi:hypothetical protein